MKDITSSSNPQFKVWRSLLSSKGIKSEGLFLLSGEKLIHEFLKNPNFEIQAELVPKGGTPAQNTAPAFQLSSEIFKELDVVGTHFNLLVLKTQPLEPTQTSDPIKGLEVIAPIGDPSNLGALIRSCVAFGVSKIHLTLESANPYHPKCVKASAGAVLKAPLFRTSSLGNWDHPSVLALDSQGPSILALKSPRQARVLVGEEGPGLPDFQRVQWVSIPTQNVESLNATVAASLLLWEMSKLKA